MVRASSGVSEANGGRKQNTCPGWWASGRISIFFVGLSVDTFDVDVGHGGFLLVLVVVSGRGWVGGAR